MKNVFFVLFLFVYAISFGFDRISVESGFGVFLDTNPYSLSGKDVDFPLRPVGDTRTESFARTGIRALRFARTSMYANLELKYIGYAVNTSRAHAEISPKIVLIRPGAWLSLTYEFIPRIAIRPVADEDDDYIYRFSEYASNDFLLHAAVRPVENLWYETEFRYTLDYYDKNFLEYDRTLRGVAVFLRYDGAFYLKPGYGYSDADCRGYDTQGETKSASDDFDASFEEDEFSLTVGNGNSVAGFDFRLTGKYTLRYYTSEKPPDRDPIHSTRKDTYYTLSGSLSYALPFCALELSSSYEKRASESEVNPEIEAIRGYNRMTIGIAVATNEIFLQK